MEPKAPAMATAEQRLVRKLSTVAPQVLQAVGDAGLPVTCGNLRRVGLQRLAQLRGRPTVAESASPKTRDVRQLQTKVETLYAELEKAMTELGTTAVETGAWQTLMYITPTEETKEVRIDEVGGLVASGDITPDTSVLVQGMNDWASFRDFIEMHGLCVPLSHPTHRLCVVLTSTARCIRIGRTNCWSQKAEAHPRGSGRTSSRVRLSRMRLARGVRALSTATDRH